MLLDTNRLVQINNHNPQLKGISQKPLQKLLYMIFITCYFIVCRKQLLRQSLLR